VIRVLLVKPSELPPTINACAVHRPGDIAFLIRRGASGKAVAEVIGRLGATMTREAVDATLHGASEATQ
jgi:hypothetical protein